MTRKALGRGLSSLLREVEAPPTQIASQEVSISLIDPNPYQPRRAFPEDSLRELAGSIRASGVIQPILLRPTGEGRYQLVAGERRWRAAKLAEIESLPAVIRDLSDKDALELALTENLLRDDLNPMDVARGYEALQQNFSLTHEDIAEQLGISRVAVTNTLRLLRLPKDIQEMISDGRLSAGHARPLLSLGAESTQLRMAKDIVRRGLSVRQAEQLVGRPESKPASGQPEAPALSVDPNLKAAVQELERVLGTRVRVTGDGNKGAIEIKYYSGEDLNRIYELILKASQH
jgi:ParB family transcriptional regulator, chromosome partitioning protein